MSHAKQLHHRRYLNAYLEIINREGLPGNIKTTSASRCKTRRLPWCHTSSQWLWKKI